MPRSKRVILTGHFAMRGKQTVAPRARSALASLLVILTISITACSSPVTEELVAPKIITDSLLIAEAGDELRLLRFEDDRGTVHEGWLRQVRWPQGAVDSVSKLPMQTVLVLGGVGTGRRAAEIIPCPPGVTVLALDYPYEGSRKATPSNLIKSALAIRRGSSATPHGVRAAIGYLQALPNSDPRGVLVIGASFGGSFILKGVAELPRDISWEGEDLGPEAVRAVSILYWGAGLPDIARYRMRERPWWERTGVAWGLQLFFSDMEPSRYVGAISPRPLLLINGRKDEFISEVAALKLIEAALEPKEQIWLPTPHLQPTAEELLLELVELTLEWLARVESPAGDAG